MDASGAQVGSAATSSNVPIEDGARATAVELQDGEGNIIRWIFV